MWKAWALVCLLLTLINVWYADGLGSTTLAEAQAALSTVENATIRCDPSTYDPLDPTTCNPRVRLTDAAKGVLGAAWTRRTYRLEDGFEVRFKYQITETSPTCEDDTGSVTTCSTRGGHGFAFVFQGDNEYATTRIGSGAEGLGYQGINNSFAFEFDSWYNFELEDLYNNHLSLQVPCPGEENSNHHSYSLGITTEIPELLDGESHEVLIVYDPHLDARLIHPALCIEAGACFKLQSMPQFGKLLDMNLFSEHMGMIKIYVDSFVLPLFVSPITVEAVLDLAGGNSTLGFTGSTGDKQWEIIDIFDFEVCYAQAAGSGFIQINDDTAFYKPSFKCVDGFAGY